MKYLFYGLLLLGALVSCKSKTSQPTKDSISTVTLADTEKVSVEKLKPILQGVWVKSDYLADVLKTNSPYKSFSKLKGYASLIIEMDSLKKQQIRGRDKS